jgi:hypothetical protein
VAEEDPYEAEWSRAEAERRRAGAARGAPAEPAGEAGEGQWLQGLRTTLRAMAALGEPWDAHDPALREARPRPRPRPRVSLEAPALEC